MRHTIERAPDGLIAYLLDHPDLYQPVGQELHAPALLLALGRVAVQAKATR